MTEEQFSDHEELAIPETLPMLPVRDVVIFPYMILPLFVGRESSVQAVEAALASDRLLFLASQKSSSQEDPRPDEIHDTGSVAMIMKVRKLPDGRMKLLVQGLLRSRVREYVQEEPFYLACVDRILESEKFESSLEAEALIRDVRDNLEKVVELGKIVSPDILAVLDDIQDPGRLADLIASNLGLKVEESQKILETLDPVKRLHFVNENLHKENELLGMQRKIASQAKEELSKSQRDYFLREQLRAIRTELGDGESPTEEIEELRTQITEAKMPPEAEKEAFKQLRRLDSMHPDTAESATVRTYLEWLVEIPWSKSTKDTINLSRARKILDEDHFGLDQIKERILEFLGVRKLRKQTKGPILCFIGPPGVGKTSLGRSIARALGRKFVRIALGGVRDEAEIRGHRRTYVGAMPGRIIQGLKQAGTNNPIFMIDEVDKLGNDAFRGDPSSALLEVLDPEQNDSFRDHYLNIPFDLSRVMFIATANVSDPIPPALRDRMEIITLSGYTEEDKVKISEKYLIPKQMEENGLQPKNVSISGAVFSKIISEYTREAGLRNLERKIAAVFRKVARQVADGKKTSTKITPSGLQKYLGAPPYIQDHQKRDTSQIGVATGLAWTQSGGEILDIEVSTMLGKGKLTLTGQLGNVMKESAQAALSYTRSRAKALGLDPDFFSSMEIHIHVPSGSIPKDGPSAGITMATALISNLTGVPTKSNVAMTGELTLRGHVLPIGGLKEKVLAARRAGITTLVMPKANKKDLDEIPKYVRRNMRFVLIETLDECLETALSNKSWRKPSRKTKARQSVVTGHA